MNVLDRRWLGPMTGNDIAFAAFLSCSFAVCSWIVLHVSSPYGDLASRHTDHMHHVVATWTFLHSGFEVYRLSFGTTAMIVPYPHFKIPWPDFPIAYPPGMFLVFLPPTLVGAHSKIESATLAQWTVLWVVLLSHVGLVGVWRALAPLAGGRAPVLIGVWLLTCRMSMYGFYDAVWVGCAAMSIAALAARRPGGSLLWFALAAFLNYRAASIAPAAAWATWSLLRSNELWWKKVAVFAVTGATCALVLWTFWMFTQHSPPETSFAYKSAMSPLLTDVKGAKVVWAMSGITALLALLAGDVLVAVSVLWATELTIRHAGHSWHGTILIGAVLLVGATRPKVPVAYLRNVLVLWMFALWEFCFEMPIFSLLTDVIHRATFK